MPDPEPADNFEIEKWRDEKSLRERELAVLEKRLELDLSTAQEERAERKSGAWKNPLAVAIFAAAVAATGNAVVSFIEGSQTRQLEASKAEEARILEMIKTGDPDAAAVNLEFLLDAGLISDGQISEKLRIYLDNREPGTGAALNTAPRVPSGVLGEDDAVPVLDLPDRHPAKQLARSIGRLEVKNLNNSFTCTGFLVSENEIATMAHCVSRAVEATFHLFPEYAGTPGDILIRVDLPPATGERPKMNDIAILSLSTPPDLSIQPLEIAPALPRPGGKLAALYFRVGKELMAVWDVEECHLTGTEGEVIHHQCDTGAGSSGSPLFDLNTGKVIAVQSGRDSNGGIAARLHPLAGNR